MSNPLRAESNLIIDGKKVRLRFDLASLAYLQEAFGVKSFGDLFNVELTSIDNLPIVITAGRRFESPDLQPADVMKSEVPYLPAIKAITQGINYAIYGMDGVPDDSPLADPKTKEAGTGDDV